MTNPKSDRNENINKELVDVKNEFVSLVNELSINNWERKITGEVWSIKEELVHVVQALQVLPKGINRAIIGGGRSPLSFVPSRFRGWVNGYIIIPRMAKNHRSETLIREYENAHIQLLLTLEKVTEEDWQKGAKYPQKNRTVEEMFHRPMEHFEEHIINIRRKQSVG